MPLVLTSNEVVINPDHDWDDVEGVQYHYPNQYKNLIKTGERFIYYRGVRRKGGKRGQPEYFGAGTIGEIKTDPATAGSSRPSWFCAVEDYRPFATPVPAKLNGTTYEAIKSNMWRNGVRALPAATYDKIIATGGLVSAVPTPPPPPVTIVESNSLLVPKAKVIKKGSGAAGGWRKSNRAKLVGDWAEDASMRFVREVLKHEKINYRAGAGETPGWDFEYEDANGQLHRVEVKGTVAAAFTSFDFTVGELNAAKAHKEGYWLFLVANCLTDSPTIQRVLNPADKIGNGAWSAQPVLFNITF